MSMRQNLFVGIRGKTYGRVTAPRSPSRNNLSKPLIPDRTEEHVREEPGDQRRDGDQ